jgi:protein-S-isoprenylcysteine O-methyltransferase Ste14
VTVRSWRLRNLPLPEPHLIAIAAGVVLNRVRPVTLPGPRHVHRLAGWLLVAAGGSLVAWSVDAAGDVDLEQPDRLVTSGPYALSRNPMYLGWALLHLGSGVLSGSAWTVATLPLAVASVHGEVRREEQRLADALGEDFERYRTTVPRYLPGLGGHSRRGQDPSAVAADPGVTPAQRRR